MHIGRAIKLCRTQRGYTQQDVADGVGISTPYLSLIERGERDPRFGLIERIAGAMGVPVVILVHLSSDTKSVNSELAAALAEEALRVLKAA